MLIHDYMLNVCYSEFLQLLKNENKWIGNTYKYSSIHFHNEKKKSIISNIKKEELFTL